MNRIAQGLTLVLLGTAALTATVPTDLYLNWVKAGFGPFLIGAGAVTVFLGVLVVVAELRGESQAPDPGDATRAHVGDGVQEGTEHHTSARDHDRAVAAEYGDGGHGHDHSRAPKVAWLLLLPVMAVFVIAPPALGSYTVESTDGSSGPPPEEAGSGGFEDALAEAGPGETASMAVQAFVMRAWIDEDREMADRDIELTGFAVPEEEGEGWYLARLQMACCAADAVVNRVEVVDDGPVPEADTWWTVRGTWDEPEGELSEVGEHRFLAEELEEVADPPDPYE
ncbi:TIGR03943 family putative permease subunit [Nocardiopsis xinjiangensis]|uniref:TIGR03943 family putative permease subunit n=1 Tax=Nocardiopsis xinjiangensis TaxID=124285 RepID=UPI0003456995|nr:TIGR03943 family protein [Nocardiopsis xinjiangensis]